MRSEPAPANPAAPAKETPVEAAQTEQAKTEQAKPEPPAPSKAEAKPSGGVAPAIEPVAGQTYLQLAAVGKPEAEMLVDVVTRKGFAAIHAPVKEKPGLFRVLVGPLKDAAAIAETRNKLNEAGLQGNEAVKRVF
jgi:cell division septation protein DedD